MVSYVRLMPNTRSAAKAERQSKVKRDHNLFWRRRIKAATKALLDLLESKKGALGDMMKEQSLLQKALDKASKEKVIHKNKASRMKARFAKKIAAHGTKPTKQSKPKFTK